jgi:hypothetical protein
MTPAEFEATAPGNAALSPGAQALANADRQVVQQVVDFLADAGPDLRRRMTEQLEALQTLKDKRTPQGGLGEAGTGGVQAS